MPYIHALFDIALMSLIGWVASWLADTPFTFTGVAMCAAFIALVGFYRVSRMLSDWQNWEDDQ